MTTPRRPIAIVGMGCRFAGAPDIGALWAMLMQGRHGFREIPGDRFPIARYHDRQPGKKGKVVTREGGFLDDIRGFDAQLFRISHREASLMDPQHRMLLEVAWQAVEDAGIPMDQLAGVIGGVYVGMFTGDYRERILRRPDFDFDVYSEIGSTRSSAAGRLAHAFDLRGPAVAVDAACASSLTAVYLAAQGLWAGETEVALAGGCNLILEPETSICFSRSGMLSPDSRCKFGDASGNGFVRSDGFGIVVLKTLDRAQADGDRIYATLEGISCNNDARQGRGLYMTPSQEGQEALIQRLWSRHQLPVDQLRYVEAHGTGTRAGDPVELGAIARVLGARRAAPEPLYVGSIKTNIGHTEGAAGIASFIKTALVLHNRAIPPSLHFHTPNPDVPWAEGRLAIPTSPVALPAEGPVLAAISSFGLSGTNAHAVLGAVPRSQSAGARCEGGWILPLSAHRPEALMEMAAGYATFLRYGVAPEELADVCWTAAVRRAPLAHRFVATGQGVGELAAALDAFTEAGEAPPAVEGAPRIAFIFSGQGGQWPGMGRALYGAAPAFTAAVDAVDAELGAQEGWSVIEALQGDGETWDISRIQPLIFTVQVALAAQLASMGLTADAVTGHSMGEVAAAHVAGILSLPDAVRIISSRSRGLARISGQGAMAVVGLTVEEAEAEIADRPDALSIAVSNAARSTVIAGDPAALDEVLQRLTAREIFCRRVDVDVASHSPQTEPLLADLRAEVAGCQPMDGEIPLYSTVDGELSAGRGLDADYWIRNMRRPVRFAQVSARMLEDGFGVFVEIGPQPVLVNALLQTIRAQGSSAAALGAMHRDDGSLAGVRAAVASAWCVGARVDWARQLPPGRCRSLPRYPFQREPFWFEEAGEAQAETSGTRRLADGRPAHPLLPRRYQLASRGGAVVWEVPLSLRAFPWLKDHRVRGSAVLPGAAYVEMALAVADEAFPGRGLAVEDVSFDETLVVPSRDVCLLQVQLTVTAADRCALHFYSLDGAGSARIHAVAQLRAQGAAEVGGPAHLGASDATDPRGLLLEELNAMLDRRRRNPGFSFGLMTLNLSGDAIPARSTFAALLRQVVRQGDLVVELPSGVIAVLMSSARDEEAVALAVRRVREGLTEGSPLGRETFKRCVRLSAVVIGDAFSDADAILAALESGTLKGRVDEMIGAQVGGCYDKSAMYKGFEELGIQYGPSFQPVDYVEWGPTRSQAELVLPAVVKEELEAHILHPALLDGCFQAAAAAFILGRDAADTWLPVGIRRLRAVGRPSGELRCRAWLRSRSSAEGEEVELDFVVQDTRGQTVVEADGLKLLRLGAPAAGGEDPRDSWLYQWRWLSAPTPTPEGDQPPPRPVQILGDGPLARRLRAALPAPPAGDEPRDGAVVALAFDAGDELEGDALLPAIIDPCAAVLEAAAGVRSGELWIVTSGVERVEEADGVPRPGLGALQGLARTVASERAELMVRLVDLGAEAPEEDLRALADLLSQPSTEEELALRSGQRYVRRLCRLEVEDGPVRRVPRPVPGDGGWALGIRRRGARWTPEVVTAEEPQAASGEVVIDVRAAEMDPAAVVAGVSQGCVIAGHVASLAPDVGGVEVGDAVVAYLPWERRPEGVVLGRRAAVPISLVAPAPWPGHLARSAASVAAYLPAQIALAELGGLAVGERVLIRAADGPAGRAAVAYAHQAGARVIATARGFDARRRLRLIGAELVLDTGAPPGPPIMDLTSGEGVDLVLELEPLPGLEQLTSLMRPAGRLLDFSGASRRSLNLDSSTGALCYVALSIDALANQRPAFVGGTLRRLVRPLMSGRLPAVEADPAMPADELVATLRDEGSAPGFGPLVVTTDVPSLLAHHTLTEQSAFRRDGTYLITGGTGGLGLALARWMATRGAGRIVLSSRSGAAGPLFAEVSTQVRALGGEVEIRPCDVADGVAVAGLVSDLMTSGPPLRGVFHLAAVLDDATLEGQDRGRFERVMAPKILGAWNLDRLTAQAELDHFVLFSSAAAVVGSPGQANYAAANQWLVALAHARRARGQAALAVDWGTWGEVGMAAAADNRGARLEARGMLPMAPDDALAALERVLLSTDTCQAGIFAMDWGRWARSMPRFQRSPVFSQLVRVAEEEPGELTAAAVSERLKGAAPDERREILGSFMRALMGEVLRMPPARIVPGRGLAQLGLDSLMTVELRGRLVDALGVELSTTRILAMADIEALADAVTQAFTEGVTEDEAAGEAALPVRVLDAAIQPQGPGALVTDPRSALLTGATGFVGAHLLRELIDATSATIHCVVRTRDPAEGLTRVRDALSALQVWREGDEARIRVLCGDLERPLLGMDEAAFDALAAEVEVIYHAGALVNHVYPYSRLEAANVSGTEEVLRLACRGTPKAVHHVSTLAVFPFTPEGAAMPWAEADALADGAEPFFVGYGQTKWMAEHLVRQARERGLDARIYRPGAITGHRDTALSPRSDLVWRVAEAVARLGKAPAVEGGIGLTPVDGVARALVELSLSHIPGGRDFHLFGAEVLPFEVVLGCLREVAGAVEVLPLEAWFEAVKAGGEAAASLAPVLHRLMAFDLAALAAHPQRADSRFTLGLLSTETRRALVVDRDLLIRYIRRVLDGASSDEVAA